MTSFELLGAFEELSALIAEKKQLFFTIESLANTSRYVSTTIRQHILDGEGQLMVAVANAKNQISSVINTVKGLSLWQLIRDIDDLNIVLPKLAEAIGGEDPYIARLPSLFSEFLRLYEVAIKNQSAAEALRLIECADAISASLTAASKMMEFLSSLLGQRSAAPDGLADLDVYLDSPTRLAGAGAKLRSLEELYEKLCELSEVSYEQYPFSVLYLEIGSLWFRGRGKSQVIKLLSTLIVRAVEYLHRTYTREGKILSIPRKVEAVDSVLKLRDELAQRGVDTSQIDNRLDAAAIIIADGLNELLGGEMKVNVNGQRYEVTDDVKQRLLPPTAQRLLEAPEETEDDERE